MSKDQANQGPKSQADKIDRSGAVAPSEKAHQKKDKHSPVSYSTERKELPLEDEVRIENLENEGGPHLD